MWEDDPRYQEGLFRLIVVLVVAGTLALAAMGWYIDDLAPLKTWVSWILVIELPWLVMATVVYCFVRLWRRMAARRAKSSPRPPVP